MHETGVGPGDKILAVDGKSVRHFGDLVHALYMIPAGEQVHLEMERDDSVYGLLVTLARSTELGPLPELEEPLDPSNPLPDPGDE